MSIRILCSLSCAFLSLGAYASDASLTSHTRTPYQVLGLPEDVEISGDCEELSAAMGKRIEAIRKRKGSTEAERSADIDEVLRAFQALKDPEAYARWISQQEERRDRREDQRIRAELDQWERRGRMPRGAAHVIKQLKQDGDLTGYDLAELAATYNLRDNPRFLAELVALIDKGTSEVQDKAGYTIAAMAPPSLELRRRLISMLHKEHPGERGIWLAMQSMTITEPEIALELLHLAVIPTHPNWHVGRNLLMKSHFDDIKADKWKPYFGAVIGYLWSPESRGRARELLNRADIPLSVIRTAVANIRPETVVDIDDKMFYQRYFRTLIGEHPSLRRNVPRWFREGI